LFRTKTLACLLSPFARTLAAVTGLGLGLNAGAVPIRLGQSAPFSGPSAQLGQEYRDGARAYFSDINRRGGLNGRTIELVSRDDGYEPQRTLNNTRVLLSKDKVFALFGYVGTPTVKAVLPLITAQGIPLIAPLSGAQLLRTPQRATVFNLRTSYQRELSESINYLVRSGRHRIAVAYQQDAFGQDGLRAAEAALRRHGLQALLATGVARNSLDTGDAARRLAQAKPNGVVMITAYGTAADLIRRLRQRGNRAQVMNVSFVGTRGLKSALSAAEADGIGISQVVPFPWDGRIPVVKEYQQLMRKHPTALGLREPRGLSGSQGDCRGLAESRPESQSPRLRGGAGIHAQHRSGWLPRVLLSPGS
jgi:ABC-type branched-subunit amino acid transport system substrate-binding protein